MAHSKNDQPMGKHARHARTDQPEQFGQPNKVGQPAQSTQSRQPNQSGQPSCFRQPQQAGQQSRQQARQQANPQVGQQARPAGAQRVNPASSSISNTSFSNPQSNRSDELNRLRKKKHRSKAPRIIIAVIVVVILALGGTGAAFALSAKDAKDDAQKLMTLGTQLKDQVVKGDMTAAKNTTNQLAETTTKLHDTTSGPLWSVATIIPVVGGDIQTVRIVSDSANTLVNDVLVPAIDTIPANGLADIIKDDGAINVSVIQDLLTIVSQSAPTITQCAAELDAAPEPTIEQLKSPIEKVKTAMSTLAPIADSATELKDTLPAILGANGKRNYLVIACTSSEMRSSVGFAGSYGLVTVDNGKISIGDFMGSAQNPRLETSVPAATDEDIRLFRWESTVDARDTTQIIDFARVGEIESQIWQANGFGKVDGVIALDTVVLQRVLGLTGTSVTTPGGDVLDGNTTSSFLLNTVYKKYPEGNQQDAVFALVANAAADAIFNNMGNVGIGDLLKTITTSTDQGRICVYMADPTEEAMLEKYGFAGVVSSDTKTPETGVYSSACLGGKMFYYLTSAIQVGDGVKNPDGSTTYDMRVEYTNTLNSAELTTLTPYITNGNINGNEDFYVYLLAPTGGKITDVKTEGTFFGASQYPNQDFAIPAGGNDKMNETTYQGNDLWYGWTHLDMGGKAVITYKVTTAPDADSDLIVRTTPLAGNTKITYN